MGILHFRAMGCQMTAMIDSQTPEAADVLSQVPGWFEDWEAALSRFRSDSELMRLNALAGSPMVVSQTLWDVLHASLAAEQASAGLVTPLVLDSLEAAGYALSFEWVQQANGVSVSPRPAVAARPVELSLGDALHFDDDTLTVTLEPGYRLDLGGVAKGWAAQEAVHRLGAFGPALVDAGGDIAVSGPRADGSAWPIAIADPQIQDADLGQLALASGGVATSGRDYRRWLVDGQPRHHLIDPRTGQPSTTDVLCVTVTAPTLRDAEVAAKTVFLLGSDAAGAWLSSRPDLKAFLVLDDGRMMGFPDSSWVTMVA